VRSEHSFVHFCPLRLVLQKSSHPSATFRIVSFSCATSRDHAVVMPVSSCARSHDPTDRNESAGLALLLLNSLEEPSAPFEPISGGIAAESRTPQPPECVPRKWMRRIGPESSELAKLHSAGRQPQSDPGGRRALMPPARSGLLSPRKMT